MAPATPFFTEAMYQNLRRIQLNAEESVHFCPYPTPPENYKEDMQIQQSVGRMQKVRAHQEGASSPRRGFLIFSRELSTGGSRSGISPSNLESAKHSAPHQGLQRWVRERVREVKA